MRQTDLWRPEKPRSYLSQNCFELLVKTITAFCNYACIAILDWTSALFGVRPRTCRSSCLRSYAGNGLIASFVRTPRSAIVFAVSSAAAFYRASGLVLWHFSDLTRCRT